MGVEPMNTGFADLQGAFALVCTRFVPIVYSTDYRFHFQRIQAHLNRHPLHYPLQCKHAPVRQMRSSEIRTCRKADFTGSSVFSSTACGMATRKSLLQSSWRWMLPRQLLGRTTGSILIESVIDGPAPLNIHENRKPELAANAFSATSSSREGTFVNVT
jgi:hypothetical protein